LRPIDQRRFLESLDAPAARAMNEDFALWANPGQTPPPGDWRVWLFLGGRGAGKTRAGAEWVRAAVRSGRCGRIALVGPTLHDVREVMIEGPSGLRSGAAEDRPVFAAGRRLLSWPNGAQAMAFSAEDPASLRGPQFDAAWGDELCYWAHPDDALATLELALRLGERPRLCLTTTPKPIGALKTLLSRPDVAATRAATRENAANLAREFIEAVERRYGGTVYGRQELEGLLIEDPEGALWRRAEVEALRTGPVPRDALTRVVVAVDPPASAGSGADACGIVAAGILEEQGVRRAVVLADASVQGLRPQGWARRAMSLAEDLDADAVVAEANNGGEMVRSVLQAAGATTPVKLVRASRGKRARAEPIAALYAQGVVTHAAAFPALEDEMCAFGASGFSGSPDRVDALVWALSDLMLSGGRPRLRAL
jgi:phage terminase large subunit-like protein